LPSQSCDDQVEIILGQIPRDSVPRQHLEVTAIGTGNGFTDIVSSFVVRAGKEVIWIDPCGYPASALARYNIHWDDISHILISHNHEDHVQGFSACLKRAEYTGKILNLITSASIYRILKKQFWLLCPEFEKYVNFIPITPRKSVQIGAIELKCRWNHHFLPFGTLGFKFSAGGKTFGFSGDTKFDESINAILKRDELLPQWFESCALVFHEVDFNSPGSVHTHWKQLEKLQQTISAQVLCYHTPVLDNGPLPQVVEGRTYHLDSL
jgi:ribonuclease BN (tRNA processing enzyme)